MSDKDESAAVETETAIATASTAAEMLAHGRMPIEDEAGADEKDADKKDAD